MEEWEEKKMVSALDSWNYDYLLENEVSKVFIFKLNFTGLLEVTSLTFGSVGH